MSGEKPFFIEGRVVEIFPQEIAIVKVSNGNIYHLLPSTPGIDYYKLSVGDIVKLEVTTMLIRVLSACIIKRSNAAEEDSNPPVS